MENAQLPFRLARYKLVTSRQKYFTELARDSFASYLRFYAALSVAAYTVASVRKELDLTGKHAADIVTYLAWLITLLGVIAAAQIIICLLSWKGYREAERDINPESPPIVWWWWAFETLYGFAIIGSLILTWVVSAQMRGALTPGTAP